AAGFADTREGVRDALGATFYAHQTPEDDLSGIVHAVVAELADMGMVEVDPREGDVDRVAATPLGSQVSKQYVTPETGVRIVEGLRATAEMDPGDVTELTILEVVCDAPDMQDTYLGNRERADMYQFATRHAAELTTAMGETDEFERWLESVKTARILYEWTEGADVETLVERYRIGPGDLESRVERVEWLLGAADALADL
ncbi:DEAD/DEAH box helicase, partial [Halobium palmae]